MDDMRMESFQKNERLENLLQVVNEYIDSFGMDDFEEYRLSYPMIFIVGVPRSGTTLLYQYLASTKLFSYPTNLMSRFYSSPLFGAIIQQILASKDFDFNQELFDFKDEVSFESNLGKTKGVNQPNEYWYFWRRFFPVDVPQKIDQKVLSKVDWKNFEHELSVFEYIFKKPLLMKGLLLNYDLDSLAEKIKSSFFIYIYRDEIDNAFSLLQTRKKFFGCVDKWYSAKPEQYPVLKNMDIYNQVAGQVICTNDAISKGLSSVSTDRQVSISYETFCNDPAALVDELNCKIKCMDLVDVPREVPDKKFTAQNVSNRDKSELDAINKAYRESVKEWRGGQ